MKNADLGCEKSCRKSRVGIFCDLQNVFTIQDRGNLLLEFAKSQGTLDCKRVYYNSQHSNEVKAKNKLETIGFQGIDVPSAVKNSADNQLIVDCFKWVNKKTPNLNLIILVLGDSDFSDLIEISQDKLGKKVIVFAQKGSASPKLIKLVGENNFYYVEQLPDLVAKKSELSQSDTFSFINDSERVKMKNEELFLV